MGFGSRGTTRNDHPGFRGQWDGNPGAAVFALLRAWAAAIIVLVLTAFIQGPLLHDAFVTSERLDSFGWRVVLLHIPTAVWTGLATLAAARSHREPFRDSSAQHLFAALAVPLTAQVANLAYLWGDLVAEGMWMSSMAVAAGCVVAMLADLALDGRD